MTAIPPELLEFAVTAKNWDEVVGMFHAVGINDKKSVSKRSIDGLHIVEVEMDLAQLTDDFYKDIESNEKISILSDSASWKRNKYVMEEIYKLELEFRKLLLHVKDLVDDFYKIFIQKARYAKQLAAQGTISDSNSLDPITSRTMLGELMEMLSFDLSISERGITGNELSSLMSNANNFSEFKKNLADRMEHKTVWDVIAKHVLKKDITWGSLEKDLKKLKNARNNAAHFHIITDSQKNESAELASKVFKIVTSPPALNKTDKTKLAQISKSAAEAFESYRKLIDSPSVKSAFTVYNNVNQSALAAAISTYDVKAAQQLAYQISQITESNPFYIDDKPSSQ